MVTFLRLLNQHLTDGMQIDTARADEAELYLEFTYLRDYWNSLGRDNAQKRELLTRLLERVPTLKAFSRELPEDMAELNKRFMGTRGARIRWDIVMPGQWSVTALFQEFRSSPDVFRDLCKFKWSFNIKPDLVILIPNSNPICIEAKLESGEGVYPASAREGPLFDELFAASPHKGRVAQFELQEFMFRELLGDRCLPVVLSRKEAVNSSPIGEGDRAGESAYLTWNQVFEALDLEVSHPFVRLLTSCNVFLRRTHKD